MPALPAFAAPARARRRLFIDTPDGRLPLALRVSGDSFGSLLDLGMGAATVDLGTLTYVSTITVRAEVDPPVATDPPTISEAAQRRLRLLNRPHASEAEAENSARPAPARRLPCFGLRPRPE